VHFEQGGTRATAASDFDIKPIARIPQPALTSQRSGLSGFQREMRCES